MNPPPIIDSCMTFEEAIAGTTAPRDVIETLRLVDVTYRAFDGLLHQGQLVVERTVLNDVVEIFRMIESSNFPVAKVIPIVQYAWSDDASMDDNNSSAFNYRVIFGTNRISRHAFGKAVDINPFLNPVIYDNGRISPDGAIYNPEKPGTLFETHPIVQEFLRRGWHWGGHFTDFKDYHHFEKQE
jgi:peptidoglycan L-alanyl-D-glutamate endopeptidase CwlK